MSDHTSISPQSPTTKPAAVKAFNHAVQARLTIGVENDSLEPEADTMADKVLRMPENGLVQRKCSACEEEDKAKRKPMASFIQKKGSQGGIAASDSVSNQINSSKGKGNSLSGSTKSFMESRFEADFSKVNIHTGGEAMQLSGDLGAKAFTVGNDIYFNSGQYAPDTSKGKRLLAHELVHVQQQSTAFTNKIIRRDVFNGPTSAPEILAEINRRLDTNNLVRMHELVNNLMLMMTSEEIVTSGVPLLIRLLRAGLQAEALSVLDSVSSAWMLKFAIGGQLVNMGGFGTDHPIEVLVARANIEEAQGNHPVTIELLKNAFYLSQMLLLTMTQGLDTRVSQTLANVGPVGANAVLFGIPHLIEYASYDRLYRAIRGIATFYIIRQRQAHLAGNVQAATRYGQLEGQLDKALRSSDILFPESVGRSLNIKSTIPTANNPNPNLLGANNEIETIRPLPGAPRPDEIAQHPYYSIEMGQLLDTFMGQELLVNEVFQFPEVVAAFPNHNIDWNSRENRTRLWIALFNGFVREHGSTDALPQLMRRIQRYLENYTFHTEYDIRDFGQSYLQSDFPTDLIGRVARDCGVYAVTVAYEVYRVARQAAFTLNFRIYTSLDHVILVIIEPQLNRHFVVSNNVISAPINGASDAEIIDSVGRSFAAIGQTKFGVAPVLHNDAGGTVLGDRNFRRRLWNKFREIGHHWGLRDRSVTNPDTQQQESLYDRHYRDLKTFNQRAQVTDGQMNDIEERLRSANPTSDQLPLLVSNFIPLANMVISDVWPLFMRLGECADIATRSRSLTNRPREFVFSAGGTVHPLVRVAIMLLRFRQLGGQLAPTQVFFICSLRRINMFNAQLQASGFTLPPCPATFTTDYRQLCEQLRVS